jgi:hypothetical protein
MTAAVPPCDEGAEAAVLGAMLVTPAVAERVMSTGIEPGDFYRERHRLIFAAMQSLHAEGGVIDAVLVTAKLQDQGHLDAVGGAAAIDVLTAHAAGGGLASAPAHARVVRRRARERRELAAVHHFTANPSDPQARAQLREALEHDGPNGAEARPDWLAGAAMDPCAVAADPVPTLPGFPFAHAGAGILISGPTGGGRSSLVQACAYDAARAGLRVAYIGSEVTEPEFNARAADLARRRGDTVDDQLREQLARVRYLNLPSVVVAAWANPRPWVETTAAAYDVVLLDPLSSVAAALDLDFDKSNAEFVRFYDKLVQPVAARGPAVVMLDNVGHAADARTRAKGASAKSDRADLTFSCALRASPAALLITAKKVRSIRCPFKHGDSWLFVRDTQHTDALPRDNDQAHDPAKFRPTRLMERVSQLLEDQDGLGARDIQAAFKSRDVHVAQAVTCLVDEGYVERDDHGPGKRTEHHSRRPFRKIDDPHRLPVSQPSPNRLPETRQDTVSPSPLPYGGRETGDTPPETPADTNRLPTPDEALADHAQALADRHRDALNGNGA